MFCVESPCPFIEIVNDIAWHERHGDAVLLYNVHRPCLQMTQFYGREVPLLF